MNTNNINYVFSPYYLKDDTYIKNHSVSKENKDDVMALYLKAIKDVSTQEVHGSLSSKVVRYNLGKHKVLILDDVESKRLDTKEFHLIATYHEETGLCILTLIFLELGEYEFHMLDQISRNDIQLDIEGEIKEFDEYLAQKFKLVKSGNPNVLISTSNKPSDEKMLYYLAGELYESNVMDGEIMSPSLHEAINTNIAQYDTSEIYCYDSTVLRVDNRGKKDIPSRIKMDVFLTYILELIAFQDAAVSRTSDKVTLNLAKQDNLTLDMIEDMTVEFGKTMTFWDRYNYKYKTAQNLSDSISASFKTEEHLSNYMRNQDFLQQIVSIKYAKNAHKETKILNFIAIFLFFVQMFPIVYNILHSIVNKNYISMNEIYLMISSSSLLFLLTLVIIRLITIKRKNI